MTESDRRPNLLDSFDNEVLIESREGRDGAEKAVNDFARLLVQFGVTHTFGVRCRPLAGHRGWWGVYIGRHDGAPFSTEVHILARLMLRRTAQRMDHYQRRRKLDDLPCVTSSQAGNVIFDRRAGN